MIRIVNGRMVDLESKSGSNVCTPEEVREAAQIPNDRMLVLQSPNGENRILAPGQSFPFLEEASISDVPSHRRGRRALSSILIKHLQELSLACPVDVADDGSYIVVHGVKLPSGYNWRSIPVLIEIPLDYPVSPPGVGSNRIYLPVGLRYREQEIEDLHESSNFRSNRKWGWFCYEAIKWDPNWDDLITLLEMIRSDLNDPKIKDSGRISIRFLEHAILEGGLWRD